MLPLKGVPSLLKDGWSSLRSTAKKKKETCSAAVKQVYFINKNNKYSL
jgi:hypothetical protein